MGHFVLNYRDLVLGLLILFKQLNYSRNYITEKEIEVYKKIIRKRLEESNNTITYEVFGYASWKIGQEEFLKEFDIIESKIRIKGNFSSLELNDKLGALPNDLLFALIGKETKELVAKEIKDAI